MHGFPRRRVCALVATVALVSALDADAQSATSWEGGVSAEWEEASNWTFGVPTSALIANVGGPEVGGSPIVVLDGSAQSSRLIVGQLARVDVREAGVLDIKSASDDGEVFVAVGSSATLNLAGTLKAGEVHIGRLGGLGELALTGDVTASRTGIAVTAGVLGGHGLLEIAGGRLTTTSGAMRFGDATAGSFASIHVTDRGTLDASTDILFGAPGASRPTPGSVVRAELEHAVLSAREVRAHSGSLIRIAGAEPIVEVDTNVLLDGHAQIEVFHPNELVALGFNVTSQNCREDLADEVPMLLHSGEGATVLLGSWSVCNGVHVQSGLLRAEQGLESSRWFRIDTGAALAATGVIGQGDVLLSGTLASIAYLGTLRIQGVRHGPEAALEIPLFRDAGGSLVASSIEIVDSIAAASADDKLTVRVLLTDAQLRSEDQGRFTLLRAPNIIPETVALEVVDLGTDHQAVLHHVDGQAADELQLELRRITSAEVTAATPASTVVGESFPVHVVVAAASATGHPVGTVRVTSARGESCSFTLTQEAEGQGHCSIASSTAGDDSVQAEFTGGEGWADSISPAFAHVTLRATTELLLAGPDIVSTESDLAVNWQLMVSEPGRGSPTGVIAVQAAGPAECEAAVVAGGCTVGKLPQGAHVISARFSGDSNFDPSETTFEIDAMAPTSAEILAIPSGSVVVGQSYDVEIRVLAEGLTPQGTVTVEDDSGASCSMEIGPADAGHAQCPLASRKSGSRSLTAQFTGLSHFFLPTTAPSANLEIGPAATLLVADVGHRVVSAGSTVDVTWDLLVVAPGAGVPTGVVRVLGTTGEMCSAVAEGVGRCAITAPAEGEHELVVQYVGDGNYTASVSEPIHLTVLPQGTQVSDLSVALSISHSGIVTDGDRVQLQALVDNRGPDDAHAVQLDLILPTGVTEVAWRCIGDSGAVCQGVEGGATDPMAMSVAAGATGRVEVDARIEGAIAENVALGMFADPEATDPDPSNNGSIATYRRCSASMVVVGDQLPPHECVLRDGYE